MQVHQENKSNEASESFQRNALKPADTSSFDAYASQLKIKPCPEPKGVLASEVVLGGSLPEIKPAVQKKAEEEEEPLQGKFKDSPTSTKQQEATPNKTGMPDNLKNGIENLSGMDLDDVKVHYNSDKPAQLQAHAYAKGTNIYVASGQEHNLPHEAWHVVQQKQGRVQPTLQMKEGVAVNDDKGLEREADVMGSKALNTQTTQLKKGSINQSIFNIQASSLSNVAQLVTDAELAVNNIGTLNAIKIGEITATQAGALTQQQFAALPANRLGNLTNAAFAALNPANCIAHILQAQARAITAGQAGAMTQQQFAALPDVLLPDLIDAAFAALNPANCIAHISQAQAGAITVGQAGAMTQQQFAALPANRLGNLINAAFAALDPANCIAHISQAQAGAITVGQAGAMTVPQLTAGIDHLQYMGANARNIPALRLRNVVRNYIRAHNWLPPFGFTGGSNFRNYQGLLTGTGPYYEYDVYPTASGRGVERIVTDGLGYHYTGNHYASFTNF